MPAAAEGLHATNQRLRAVLDLLAPKENAAYPEMELLAGLLAELLQAGQWLPGAGAKNHEPELASELAEYRSHMERLQRMLPTLEARLLTERARLEAERAHLAAAAAWVAAAQQTT